ncbi:bifunctional diguanylate cyclase/phosphodiesterase [Cellulomonas sp. WB94]|uniref:putative bifunctional diguanylate cyclase/phosphodiesterase n=1 Tax=Cellulomonas sp. WB94 TaxID=2173174 RepID=UPI001304CD4E|nr:bifunctional diguanylate cyclase/phosphodiesterase [Cellulomonas sp. WB94]
MDAALCADPRLSVDLICAHNLLDSPWAIIYFKDLESRFIKVSVDCARVNDMTQGEMIGLTDFDLTDYANASALLADEQRIIATGVPMIDKEEVDRFVDQPGTWVETSKFPLRDADGSIIGTFGISRDVTRREFAEQQSIWMAEEAAEAHAAVARAEAQLRAVLDGSTDAIAKYDEGLRYQYINPAGERLRGLSLAELEGRTDRQTGMAESSLWIWEAALNRVLGTGEPNDVEFSSPDAPDESSVWFHVSLSPDRDDTGAVVGVFSSTRDITDLKRAEHALAHQAMHDSLTGLANRYLLTDRLSHALERKERSSASVALFFIDLDHFKDVNDAYGHEVGDRVLVDVARRLEHVARRGDTVARLGGDEFILLLDDEMTDDDVPEIAERIVAAFARPFSDGAVTFQLSASVGAAIAEDPTIGASGLLQRADSAMYRAKVAGRSRFEVFDPRTRSDSSTSNALEVELRSALEAHELKLLYQPRLALGDRQILGFEALLRWDHPERGTLGPADFLAAAEFSGLIIPIGAWVLNTACAQLGAWTSGQHPAATTLAMAVNVSGRQVREPHFAELVSDTLNHHGIAPWQLCLEITERELAIDNPTARETLTALAALGVQLAVDNFGATYTSLSRLPQFPVSVVKLEKLSASAHDRRIAAMVIAMAHGLGMRVVGERIETTTQLNNLEELTCDDGQGYLLGRPMSTDDVDRMLQGEARTPTAGLDDAVMPQDPSA